MNPLLPVDVIPRSGPPDGPVHDRIGDIRRIVANRPDIIQAGSIHSLDTTPVPPSR